MSSELKAALRPQLMRIAKRNSICINRQLSIDEYESEVWPLANKAIDEILDLLQPEIERLVVEARIDEQNWLRKNSNSYEADVNYQLIDKDTADNRLADLQKQLTQSNPQKGES